MKLFEKRSLASKISLPFLLIMIISIFFLVHNVQLVRNIKQENAALQETILPAYHQLEANLALLDRIVKNIQFAVSTQELEWIDQNRELAQKIEQNIALLHKMSLPWLDSHAMQQQFQSYFTITQESSLKLLDVNSTNMPIDQEAAQQLIDTYNATHKQFEWALINTQEELESALERNSQRSSMMVRHEIIFMMVLIVIFYLTRRYVIRHVIRPVSILIGGTKNIAQGDYAQTIDLHTGDEIEKLAHSFNEMSKKLDISIQEITNQQEELCSANEQLNALNASLEEKVEEKLTEIRDKDQLLIQQARFAALGEMISMIAHQWRQPLNVLNLTINKLEVLQDFDKLTPEAISEAVHKSEELIQGMSTTIDDFRSFFRPSKKQEEFPLQPCIQKAHALIQAQLKIQNTILKEDVDSSILLFGVANEMEHVLLNLIGNARDALKDKEGEKIIAIEAMQNDDDVQITVSDTGGGVPEDIIHKIFDPYFTTKHSAQGTGIGLYMTKTIVEQHFDGTISVHNTAKGAQFTIVLPKDRKEQNIEV